jgi:hypothetical protein
MPAGCRTHPAALGEAAPGKTFQAGLTHHEKQRGTSGSNRVRATSGSASPVNYGAVCDKAHHRRQHGKAEQQGACQEQQGDTRSTTL